MPVEHSRSKVKAPWKQSESKVIAILKQSDMSFEMEEKLSSKLILLK